LIERRSSQEGGIRGGKERGYDVCQTELRCRGFLSWTGKVAIVESRGKKKEKNQLGMEGVWERRKEEANHRAGLRSLILEGEVRKALRQ